VRDGAARRAAAGMVQRLGVKTPSLRQRAKNLSGGNQQKIVLAKWLRTSPKVLLLDEPSQGVDVGAKAALYGLIGRSAAAGAAVLVSSSDTEELVALCDRVLVMRDGQVATEVAGADLTEEALLAESLSASTRFERS
jgi:ribose transport system ATP-binding protein